MTAGYTLPYPVSFSFSVMEALYARGFRGAADITALSEADFQQALTGTVAYDYAMTRCTQGTGPGAGSSPPGGQPGGAFQPINPDGSLVDCVPPPCLSPTGPIAYLQEMLTVSELSTCDDLAALTRTATRWLHLGGTPDVARRGTRTRRRSLSSRPLG